MKVCKTLILNNILIFRLRESCLSNFMDRGSCFVNSIPFRSLATWNAILLRMFWLMLVITEWWLYAWKLRKLDTLDKCTWKIV